jgi:hypothetical protein
MGAELLSVEPAVNYYKTPNPIVYGMLTRGDSIQNVSQERGSLWVVLKLREEKASPFNNERQFNALKGRLLDGSQAGERKHRTQSL